MSRRYLTFSLRTLFLALTALAVWLGVVVHRAREQREAVEAIEAAGGCVGYDWQFDGREEPPGPHWLRQVLGDEFFQEAISVNFTGFFETGQAGKIESLPYLREVDIRALIPSLKRLHRLEWIETFHDVSNATILELETALSGVDIRNDY